MASWLKTIVILLVLAGAGYYGYGYYMKSKMMAQGGPPGAGAPPGMMGPSIGVAEVKERGVRLWHEFSGRITAVEQVEVRPRVAGMIDQVHFRDGAMVAKGDLLFTLDRRPYQAEVDRAAGALAAAEAAAERARKEADRAEGLLKDKSISQRDFDQRRGDALAAEANVKSAAAALEQARLNFEYSEVRAPVAGRVGRAEITAGNLVGLGEPVLTVIVSSDPVYADFEMDEATFLHYVGAVAGDVTRIPVMLALAAETGETRTGHVSSFDNRIDVASATVRVRAVFDNKDGKLVPGMFARVLIGSAEERNVLLVTERAVGTDQDKKFVLVMGADGKTERRTVRLGPRAEGLRIVEEGLKAGEKIVVRGLQQAQMGMPVRPEEVPMDGAEMPPVPAQGAESKQ